MRRNLFKTANLNAEKLLHEVIFLRDKVAELEGRNAILRSMLDNRRCRRRPTLRERLSILWHMEYFQIPKRRVREYFSISRSTLKGWIRHGIREGTTGSEPANKTPLHLVAFVWDVFSRNPAWGKLRIAQQLALLNIFLSASTVRNILHRAKPQDPSAKKDCPTKESQPAPGAGILATHPNHVWSADLTTIKVWGVWPVHIFVAIDHFSRKLLAVVPLRRPTAECVRDALMKAIQRHQAPTHCFTDQGTVFTAPVFEEILKEHNATHHLGSVGVKASVAITERVIETLKYEWLRRLSLIRGRTHLTRLCGDFLVWYGALRPHQSLGGNRPDDVYCGIYRGPIAPEQRSRSKVLPPGIGRVQFEEPRTTAWHLYPVS